MNQKKNMRVGTPNEHRLYNELSKFVMDWMKERNNEGIKPYQSEVIGALEMVKTDIYALHSAERIISQSMKNMFKNLDGKTLICDGKSVIIEKTKTNEGAVFR